MKLFALITLAMAMSMPAHAQLWGTGISPAVAACPAPYARKKLPDGLQDIQDDIDQLKKDRAELDSDRREFERDLREVTRDHQNAIRSIEGVLLNGDAKSQQIDVAKGVINHIIEKRPGVQATWEVSAVCPPNGDGSRAPWGNFCEPRPDGKPSLPATEFWTNVREGEDGAISSDVCSKKGSALHLDHQNDPDGQARCASAVNSLGGLTDRKKNLEASIKDRKEQIAYIDQQLAKLRQDMKEERRELRRAERNGESTEGGYCYSCEHPNERPVSTVEKLGAVALGGLGAYLGYRFARKGLNNILDQNEALGYYTPPHLVNGVAMGGAMPGIMFGLYGLTNGFGAGGCGGQFGGLGGMGGLMGPAGWPMGGGAFGYPGAWNGMPGGGMFMPGYGPGMGYGMPGYGAPFIGGIIGAFMGMPMGGYMGMPMSMPMMGMPMMPMQGMPMMPMGGGYGGMPMMPMSGMPMSTLPYPAGGGMPMMPMQGGMPMMPMQGGMPMMPMQGGMPMAMPMQGGMPMMPMQGGMPMGMPMAPNAGMQYQMFMMQQQQQMMQMQMQAYQDYMNRQQMIGRLSSQMMQIQMQIQQISAGVYGGGYYGGGGYGGVGGGGVGGPQILPYPGQPGAYQPMPGQPSPYDPNTGSGQPIPSRGR